MTMSNVQHAAVSAEAILPPQVAHEVEISECDGHPLRRKGITFVTNEVEAKGLFGLPHWNAFLERAGLKKHVKAD